MNAYWSISIDKKRGIKGDYFVNSSTSAYELNINYFSALSHIEEDERDEMAVQRFVAASAIMVFFKGIPGIYIHSLIGSRNWFGDATLKDHPRRINREKIDMQQLEQQLSDPKSLRSALFTRMLALLEIRKREAAFSPWLGKGLSIQP
ncbi:MAG: hypothetical protein RBR15_07695 [Sphaerochaeta sp.]|nr:hypothetical protein [Sphaerochaeta sp.]